ncbi:MAG: hypothetical protein GWN31_11525, partial [Candidatus Thorarchaeota archaeon]|nr:hypothetical protein [Candidatus Thorarchaeota archaeon]NIW52606.1 hypothetical protein [Candidatus Korarchaeota archaeon]
PGTKVDRIKVLAEYIDALKFMITLGNVWGFTPEEVLDEFYRKTEEVETNFKSKVDAP